MTIGERIKEIRVKLGMSQVDFADKTNVSKQTLYKYENNIITNIPSDKIEASAKIGNVSPAYLMGWEQVDANFSGKEVPKEIYDKFRNNVSKFHGDSKELLDIYQKLSSPNQKKVLTYSRNLLVNQQMEEDLTVQAAHSRTDIEVTDEMNQHDDDIMDDENF